MGNVLAASAPPPPPPTFTPPPPTATEQKPESDESNDLNPGTMEDLHKKCKGCITHFLRQQFVTCLPFNQRCSQCPSMAPDS